MPALMFLVLILAIVLAYYALNSSPGPSRGAIPVSNIISHWRHFFESVSFSSDGFYKEVEAIIKDRQMPHAVLSRATRKEAGILSASREYLRIKHGDIVIDLCAAPFGKDFFISWWLYETTGTMRRVFKNTRLGNFLQARAEMRTFYQIDEEEMFRSSVHNCILHTIEKISTEKGFANLSAEDKAFRMGGL